MSTSILQTRFGHRILWCSPLIHRDLIAALVYGASGYSSQLIVLGGGKDKLQKQPPPDPHLSRLRLGCVKGLKDPYLGLSINTGDVM